MYKKTRLFAGLICFCVYCNSDARAQTAVAPAALFKAGNAAYAQKDYTSAIAQYEQMTANGIQSAELYYNIANGYAQNKNIGQAILYYERALRLTPFYADAAHNLRIVSSWRKDDIEPLQPFFLIRWAKFVRNAAGSNTWASISLGCLAAIAAGAFFLLFGATTQRKRQGLSAAAIALLLSPLPFWCAYETRALAQHSGFAIIISPEIVLHNAPDPESSDIMTLHEGTKLEVLDQISDWLKVELPNSEQGWLPESAVAEI